MPPQAFIDGFLIGISHTITVIKNTIKQLDSSAIQKWSSCRISERKKLTLFPCNNNQTSLFMSVIGLFLFYNNQTYLLSDIHVGGSCIFTLMSRKLLQSWLVDEDDVEKGPQMCFGYVQVLIFELAHHWNHNKIDT